MEEKYSIEEILKAIDDLKNFKRVNTSKIEPNKTNIPPNTLKLIEDAEKTIKLNSKSE